MLKKRIMCAALSALLTFGVMPATALSAQAASKSTTLTFSDSSITETVSGSGYTIDGTTVTISASGVYKIKGNCSEGSIVVSKSLDNVILIFEDLTLTSAETAPVVVKKGSNVTVHLDGTSTLTDNEDASTEETNENFEGAAIKVKSGSTVTFCGEGTLNIRGNAKNGIKGAAESSQIFNGGNYNITAANNGIAADESVTINGGSFTLDTDNDGIKSVPDADDTISTGNVTINGGTFNITSDGDGIQAENTLKITNGNFTIKTLGGYNDTSFNSDTMSCKGLKASGDREDIENNIIITGGSFDLNTADDAVHSDTNAEITGGTFRIYTGDDGVHADTQLDLGVSSGLERDPEFYIYSSYEGLESGTVNMYSGKYWVVASDDGINAAGGSSNGSDPGMGGGNTFNPGGRPGGGPGGPGGSGSSGGNTGGGTQTSGDYALNIYGGTVYVNALGDGLDSNGTLNMTGGTASVFSMQSGGDNSPLDCDGTMIVNGATLFAVGTNPMNENPSTSTSQSYYKQSTSLSAGTVVTVKNSGTVLYSDTLLRNINYLLYSAPNVSSSSVSVATGGTVDSCKSNAFAHNWNSGTVVTAATDSSSGKIKYTCSDCGAVEYKTIASTVSQNCSGHEDAVIEEDEGYNVTFAVGSGAKINVYNTQDYSTVSTSGATAAVSRNSDTGLPDSTGEGQVNFSVVLASGYELDSVTVSGGYKNLKDVSTDTLPNTYRVTKVTSDLTITVTTKKTAALTNTSVISGETAQVGDEVSISASANGGTAPYTYAYYYKKSTDSSWTKIAGYSTSTSGSFTPESVGTYTARVNVKDNSGTVVNKDFTVTVKADTTALTNNSTISATTVTAGTEVTMTGKAAGGTSPYKYAYYYKKSTDSSWTKAYVTSSGSVYTKYDTMTFTPTTAGTYNVRINVKDKYGEGTVVTKDFKLTVTAASTALTNNSTVSATTVTAGTEVTLTGKATGGTSPYKYAYYYKKSTDSSWTKAYVTSSGSVYTKYDTMTFTPTTAGTYTVRINVKDKYGEGTVVTKDFKLTVTAASAALTNNSTVSATTVTAGTEVTMNGKGSGGTSPYKYAYYYKKSTDSSWTKEYVTSSGSVYTKYDSMTFTPKTAGTYTVRINVKDKYGEGTVVSKDFTITVK